MKEGRKPEYPEKTLGDELTKMPYSKPKDSSPKRDSNPHDSIGGSLGKQTCKSVKPGVAPKCLFLEMTQSLTETLTDTATQRKQMRMCSKVNCAVYNVPRP